MNNIKKEHTIFFRAKKDIQAEHEKDMRELRKAITAESIEYWNYNK